MFPTKRPNQLMILHAVITQEIIVWRKGVCLPFLLPVVIFTLFRGYWFDCLFNSAAFANRWLVFCYLSVCSGCWRLVWLLPRRVKTTWRKQIGRQVATIWYAVSGTTFFTEDINLQKISCRSTKDYNKIGTKWQLADLEVSCRIHVTLMDDEEVTSLDCGTLKHDLLSTVLREGYTQRDVSKKVTRFSLCAFQRQEQVLLPKGIVQPVGRVIEVGSRIIFFEYPSILLPRWHCYKSGGSWFGPRWCQWNFLLT